MSTPFSVLGIDHVVLRTAEPARLEAFYTAVLGCPVEKRQEKIGLTQLRAGRSLIDILTLKPGEIAESPGSSGGNMDHLCLRIDPFDVEAIRRHLAGHGIDCGEVLPRYGAEGSGPSIYFDDPEGNRVELKGPPAS
jgi:glyoxylase I family protein